MARNDPQVNFRIPKILKEKLESSALKYNRTITAELVTRLNFSFEFEGYTGLHDLLDLQDPQTGSFDFDLILSKQLDSLVKEKLSLAGDELDRIICARLSKLSLIK